MHPDLKAQLQALLGERVQFEIHLKPFTSLRIGGPADAITYPNSAVEVTKVVQLCNQHETAWRLLGGGTNLLVADTGYAGVLLCTTRHMNRFHLEREEEQTALLFAECGVRMSRLLSFCSSQGLAGMEFAAGIPGTFGGVLWMNGGTRAGSVDEILHSMQIIGADGQLRELQAAEVPFRYRSCGLPRNVAILSGRVELKRGEPRQINAKVAKIKSFRENQPLEMANAGSVFKNPKGDFAGRLIEMSGLKGKCVGGAMISDRHANFIINRGDASAEDVLRLIQLAKERVYQEHGIELETELEVLA